MSLAQLEGLILALVGLEFAAIVTLTIAVSMLDRQLARLEAEMQSLYVWAREWIRVLNNPPGQR